MNRFAAVLAIVLFPVTNALAGFQFRQVAKTGDQLPGLSSPVASFGHFVAINDTGTVAFKANLANGSQAIVRVRPNALGSYPLSDETLWHVVDSGDGSARQFSDYVAINNHPSDSSVSYRLRVAGAPTVFSIRRGVDSVAGTGSPAHFLTLLSPTDVALTAPPAQSMVSFFSIAQDGPQMRQQIRKGNGVSGNQICHTELIATQPEFVSVGQFTSINDSGLVAFYGSHSGSLGRGVFVGTGAGRVTTNCVQPDTPDVLQVATTATTPTFAFNAEARPSINSGGQVAFFANGGPEGEGVYLGRGGEVPGLVVPIGGDVATFDGSARVALTNSGDVAFVGTTGSGARAIFRALHSAVPDAVLRAGDDIGDGDPIQSFELWDGLNGHGQVAFWAHHQGGAEAVLVASEACIPSVPSEQPTYIAVTINGQHQHGFIPLVIPTVQAWVPGVQNRLGVLMAEVNHARTMNGQQAIQFLGIHGDWAAQTADGASLILLSRVLYLTGSSLPPIAYAAGRIEARGRARTSQASIAAARRIAHAVQNRVRAAQTAHPTQRVFVDFVAHSRGGAVTSEILRILGPQNDCVRISATLLDAIDPSEAPLDRPRALAGHLLGDPLIEERAGVQFSNFRAFTVDDNFFGPGFLNWAVNFAEEIFTLGIQNFGWPVGHARPELSPLVDELRPENHNSLVDSFVANLSATEVNDQPNSTFSFLWTTSIGRLVANPTMPSCECVAPPGPMPDRSPPPRGVNFVSDPEFDEAGELIVLSQQLLADTAIQAVLTEDVAGSRYILERTASDQFVLGDVWEASGPGVTIQPIVNDPQAIILGDATLSQAVEPESMEHDSLDADVWLVFSAVDGSVTLTLAGNGVAASTTVAAAVAGVGQPYRLRLTAPRTPNDDPPVPDRVSLTGSAVRIESVRVVGTVQLIGDLDGDCDVDLSDLTALLSHFGTATGATQADGDADADGDVDLSDLTLLLANFGTTCP